MANFTTFAYDLYARILNYTFGAESRPGIRQPGPATVNFLIVRSVTDPLVIIKDPGRRIRMKRLRQSLRRVFHIHDTLKLGQVVGTVGSEKRQQFATD